MGEKNEKSDGRTDGRTDMTNVICAFREYEKRLKVNELYIFGLSAALLWS